jgi:hypothetical protein
VFSHGLEPRQIARSAGAGLGGFMPIFVTLSFLPLASIPKCVYLVLCYNQCISFVAIEKYVGLFLFYFDSTVIGGFAVTAGHFVGGSCR